MHNVRITRIIKMRSAKPTFAKHSADDAAEMILAMLGAEASEPNVAVLVAAIKHIRGE